MPTYDYRCKACEHEFEEFQSMTAKPLRKCPDCGRLQLERLIGTGAGVIFKGSGFYETDYRSESYRKDAEKDSKKPEKGKDSKSDSSSGKPSSSGDSKKTEPTKAKPTKPA